MKPALALPLDVRLMTFSTRLLVLGFVALALGEAASWVATRPVFALRGISVFGDVTHNNAVTLRANVAPFLKGTFLTVDLPAVRQAFEAVPWVRRAVVRRDFPNRLKVILQEHQAVGFWGEEGESRLINNFGEVFEANVGEVEQDDLPRLNGPLAQSAQVLALYQALQPRFAALDLPVSALELSGRGSWRMALDTGAMIELGRGTQDEVLARCDRFLVTLSRVVARYGRSVSALEAADLRYAEGYALRLRGVSTVQTAELKK